MFNQGIVCISLLATTLLFGVTTAAPSNVVFMVVDDWGWSDGSWLGSDFYQTSNIDEFARTSLKFNCAYAAAPVCSPTRAALLTGKHPARLDMTIWHEGAVQGGPRNRRMLDASAIANLPREETTLAELFKAKGYSTCHIGKKVDCGSLCLFVGQVSQPLANATNLFVLRISSQRFNRI